MSREDVIREIVIREAGKKDLAEDTVRLENPSLHDRACEFFGTWKTALIYSGIAGHRASKPKPRNSKPTLAIAKNRPTPKIVIEQIQRMCWHGSNLKAQAVESRNPQLYAAAKEYFGSWQDALKAAEVRFDDLGFENRSTVQTRESLIQELRSRYESGQTLVGLRVSLENRNLISAVRTEFGCWSKGLLAAGIPKKPTAGSRWNIDSILKKIKELADRGESLQCVVVRKRNSGLVTASRKYFPKWSDAVAAAGCAEPAENDK